MRTAAKLATTKPPMLAFDMSRASTFAPDLFRASAEPSPLRFDFLSTRSLAVAILFAILATCQPAAAQGLATFARQASSRTQAAMSFASLASIGATFSVTSTSPMYHPENSADEFAFRAATYYAPNFGAPLPVLETKTSFVTEVRVPLAQLYGSRVHLGFFILTFQNGNMTFGPLATLQALHSPSLPRSVNLYGVGLSIPLTKEARPEIPKNLWSVAHHFLQDR